jgi:hypothetical protein
MQAMHHAPRTIPPPAFVVQATVALDIDALLSSIVIITKPLYTARAHRGLTTVEYTKRERAPQGKRNMMYQNTFSA